MTDYELVELIIEDSDMEEETQLTEYSHTTNKNMQIYFIGFELALLLGYKNTTSVIKNNISQCNKILFRNYQGEKKPIINPKTILINKEGAIELINKCRKKLSSNVFDVLQKSNIYLTKTSLVKKINNEDKKELTEYSFTTQDGIMFEYFVGYEIASLLGYKNVRNVIKNNVSKSNQLLFKDYSHEKIPLLHPRTILITRDGAIEILLKTRKRISPDVLHLLEEFGIQTTNKKCLTKEQQTLSAICNAFKTENFEDQYKVGKYYIDLYFPYYKLAVECDENGHQDRRPGDERKRMDFINNQLQINDDHWIRFNPDSYNFDVTKIIGKLYTRMKMKGKWVPEYVRATKSLKNIDLSPTKPCNACKNVKSLGDFFKAKDHRDGRENTCKICTRKRQKKYIESARQKYTEEHGEKTEKECNVCEDTLKIEEFYRDSNSCDGYGRKCKICHKKRIKERAQKPKPPKEEKKCSKCEITKKIAEFHKCTASADGYKIHCKECTHKKAQSFSERKKEKRKKYLEKNGKMTEKECNICENTLKVKNFYRDSHSLDGYMKKCKTCHSKRRQELIQINMLS